jgi:glycerophosphoryl diester phosphodiesterase
VATRVALLVLALFVVGLFVGIRLASSLADDSTVAVTAHRGASIGAPENTMASFNAALAAGADFIELDVQRASDGTVVVVHDGDLMRLGGDPRKVGSLAWPDFASVDVGSHFDPSFAAERVPKLEHVIDVVRGRMKINVELKYNVPDPELAPAVIDLLRSKQFLDQVVITSLDAAALHQVKGIDPDVKTGLIVTAAVGNVAQTEADFVSLNAAQATTSLVRRMHAAGKQVHVWTVNTPEAMQVMMERGVDNIITDDPALLRKVMGERAGLTHGEKLALRLRVLFDRPPREATDAEAVKVL